MDSPATDHLEFAPEVTREHAERFAEEWFQRSIRCMELCESVDVTRIIESPGDEDESRRAALMRYFELVDEILDRTLETAKGAMADAFVKIASEVIVRERGR